MQSHDVSLPQGLCRSTAQRLQLATSTIIHTHQHEQYILFMLIIQSCQTLPVPNPNDSEQVVCDQSVGLTPVVWPWHKAWTASPSGLRQNLCCAALVGFRHNWAFRHLIFSIFFFFKKDELDRTWKKRKLQTGSCIEPAWKAQTEYKRKDADRFLRVLSGMFSLNLVLSGCFRDRDAFTYGFAQPSLEGNGFNGLSLRLFQRWVMCKPQIWGVGLFTFLFVR